MSSYFHSSHMRASMQPESLRKCINLTTVLVKKVMKRYHVDAIAITGISGASVGFAVAANVNLPIIFCRKPGDNSHACNGGDTRGRVDGPGEIKGRGGKVKYLIIDDFISSGKTLSFIISTIAQHVHAQDVKVECVGAVLYRDSVTNNGEKVLDNGTVVRVWAQYVEEIY